MTGSVPLWVVKVGGSLLGRADGRGLVGRWLAELPSPIRLMVLAGGGALADRVRELDRRIGLGPAAAHRMAVQAMRANLEVLRRWWPGVSTCASIPAAGNWEGCRLADVAHWLALEDGVPESWDFTSDSIAALLAWRCEAERLVLLKSCPVQSGQSAYELAEAGIVDPCFPGLAGQVRTWEAVGLISPDRADKPTEAGPAAEGNC